MTSGLEKLGRIHQNCLERDLSGLLLKTLVVGRRQQSESFEVCSSCRIRDFDEPF